MARGRARDSIQVLVSLVRGPNLHVAEARGSGAVSGAHGLHGLAFAAVGCSPQRPLIARADGVHGIPEFSGDAGVGRIFEHASELATFDFPADLGSKLKVVALIVNGPGAVGLHVDAVVSRGQEL